MTSRDFCDWLQGCFEIFGKEGQELNTTQVKIIQAHLSMVFKHEIDPSMGDAKHQAILDAVHNSSQLPKYPPKMRC